MRGHTVGRGLNAALWAFCLLLPLAAHSQQATSNHIDQPSASEEAQDTSGNQETAHREQPSLSPNVALFALPLPIDDQPATEKPKESAKADKSAEGEGFFAGIKWTDAVIALFTIILGIYTARRYYATKGLWDAAKGQGVDMKASIAAANAAAKAAGDQVALSRVALTSTERAFIVPDPIIAYPIFEEGTKTITSWQFRIVWRNVGRTSTQYMVNNSGLVIRHFNKPPVFQYIHKPIDTNINSFGGPDRTAALDKHSVIIDALNDTKASMISIYLWGWADYDDVFDSTPRHRTEVCVKIIVVGNPTNADCGFGYQLVGPFNGTDRECQHRPAPYQS